MRYGAPHAAVERHLARHERGVADLARLIATLADDCESLEPDLLAWIQASNPGPRRRLVRDRDALAAQASAAPQSIVTEMVSLAVGDELAAVAERDERARQGHEQPPEAVAHPNRGAAHRRRLPSRLNHFLAHGGAAFVGAAAFGGAEPSRAFAAATSLLAS